MIETRFGLDLFHVDNCRNKGDHNDSDWLYLTVINGQTFIPTQARLLGDNLHAGDEVRAVLLGPFTLDETKLTTATFAVVNLGHPDGGDQKSQAAEIALAIDAGLAGVAAGILGIAGELGAGKDALTAKIAALVFGVIGTVFATVLGVDSLIPDSNPDCSGEVFKRLHTFLPGELHEGTIFIPAPGQSPIIETADSQSVCGNAPHTQVRYQFSTKKLIDMHFKPSAGNIKAILGG